MAPLQPLLAPCVASLLLTILIIPASAFIPTGVLKGIGGLRGTGVGEHSHHNARSRPCMTVKDDHDILLRVARGERADRSPVWLMRQAGRYMADFRKYSDKYAFRHRSETPEIAIELSLQPWRTFGVDGVIMFSDILTPLPAMGIDFDVVKGKGPVIHNPVRSPGDVAAVRQLKDIDGQLPFVGQTLKALRQETEGKATLLGFVGAPWTLAAYSMEGGSSKHALHTKEMMMNDPTLFHALMAKMAQSVGDYACYQVEHGAQVIQVFESWAHQLVPLQFEVFAKPYADLAMSILKARHPNVPVIYFANGGSSYLERQRSMKADMLSLDQFVDMTTARERLGRHVPVSGNVDPLVLLGPKQGIIDAVNSCIVEAGGQGHILNLGHGVLQQTPEKAVATFVDAAKSTKLDAVMEKQVA
ncbi:unnamed protein product [Choristocarpus tenellus]